MAFTHVFTQTVLTPEELWADTSVTYTGDTITAVATTVDSYSGGAANSVTTGFVSSGLQSMVLQSTVPCVVTLTGATVIDGVTVGTVTLTANVIRHVTAITGTVTAISVGANTTPAGAAGTIKISVVWNS